MRTLPRIIVFVWLYAAIFTASTCITRSAFAQGARHNDIALGRDGHIAPGASVAVCSSQGVIGYGNSPCSPLATIYTDATLSTPAANPFNADPNGDYGFWAPPGTYQVQVYGPQIGAYIQTVTIPCVPNTNATGCGSVASQANNNFTGANTFSGDALFKSGDPWFDVKAFGARCDDATDDTAAIRAALAAVPAIGGLIEIPGVCKFTQPLVIATPNVTIEGHGHFQFITQNAPVTYLDYQGLTGNAITVSAQGFKMRDVGVKYPTTIGGPVAAPAAPTLTQVAGSGCPVEPYFAEITYVTAQGETNVSAESTFTTTAGNCLEVLSPPAASGVTGWNAYVSANSNNETKQTSAPLAIGTNWTFTGTLQNLGFRPPFNTTAYSAIYDPNGAQLDGVKIFTDASASAGTASMANGYTSFGCCGKLHNVYIAGFGLGIAGAGSNNDFSVTDSYIQNNFVGAFIVNGADINLVRNDFEGNVSGNIKLLYGSPYTIAQNYFEEESSPPSYNVQVGDSSIPPQGFTPTPGAMVIEGNFMQCNLTAYPPAPIIVDTSAVLRIERNSFSQCGNEKIVDNLGGSSGHIRMVGNISDAQPLAWLTSATGVDETDINGTQKLPGQPYFYNLGVDSTPANASSLTFRQGGAKAWGLSATTSALSFTYNADTGENTLQLKPFGSQSVPSVQSNFAMAAAEVIVTESAGAATFDAGLGNMFELTMNATLSSTSLVNVQNGQWLTFIICQGAGGPFLFSWPANVFGGGTVGSVGGNCSTQHFVGSGGNAWAAGPMTTDISLGSSGLSMPGVTGTVPYFTGAWTSGDCLQAGGSPGLISVAANPCGTGGGGAGTPGGTNTAVQFNNTGAFGGDASNFSYNSTTHNLSITGALTTAANSFLLTQLVNPAAAGDEICANSTPVWTDCTSGLPARTVTGTTDAVAATDRGNMITYSGSSPVAVTLPVASSFGNNFFFHVEATSAGVPTFSPASGTINGNSSFTPPANSFGTIYSPDNVNYTADFTLQQSNFSAGTCTLVSGACSHTFIKPYSAAPSCSLGASATGNTYKIVPSVTAITITSSSGTDTSSIGWTCMAANN